MAPRCRKVIKLCPGERVIFNCQKWLLVAQKTQRNIGGYEASDTNGFAYVYDLSLSNVKGPAYTECPGGGHDCWFIEKYDSEGTMTGVVNKENESMLEKLADDIWGDKWDMENTGIVTETKKVFEFKNGKLISKRNLPGVDTGNVVKPTDVPTSMYFTALFISMKLSGAKKPSKITLKIRNAKDLFDKRKNA